MRILKSKGFTVVELLVVIVVIAILASVSTLAFSGVQKRAQDASRASMIGSYAKGIQAYVAINGAYPGNLPQVASGNPLLCLDGTVVCYSNYYGNNGSVEIKQQLNTVISNFPDFKGAFFTYGTISSPQLSAWTGYYIQVDGMKLSCPAITGLSLKDTLGSAGAYSCRYGFPSL